MNSFVTSVEYNSRMNLFVIIGGLIGFAFGRFFGMLLGAGIGYWAHRQLKRSLLGGMQQLQASFLESTFAVMGAICKADGHVSEQEIRVAEALFDRLRLNGAARETAKSAFRRGKATDFDLDAEVARFARLSRGQRVLHSLFLQLQLQAIAADGQIHPAEHQMLLRVARGLGLSEHEVRQLEAMLRTGRSSGSAGGSYSGPPPADRLADAYAVLGVSKDASDSEIKRAYRKLMSENHPDKLAAKGLPESMRAMAEERTREITTAYDLIKQARGV